MAPSEFSQAQRVTYLISRYVDGVIDFGELQELDHWRKQKQSNEDLFQQLIDPAQQEQTIKRMQDYDSKASLEKIKTVIQQEAGHAKNRTINLIKLLFAASTIIFIGILLFLHFSKPQSEILAARNSSPQYIPAGTNKAILTLANGKKVTLDDKHNGTIAAQSGSVIQKISGGLISYHQTGDNKDKVIEYNTIETPRGGQYRLVLADGTKVWLNAASSLRYPSSFQGKQRVVTLTGEGYFEVAHKAHLPFLVKTETQQVVDIGTHFNINAYIDEPQVTTTLVEGIIAVSSSNTQALLKPGQATLNRSGKLTVSIADIEAATAWKNGVIYFRKTDIKIALRQISRWYNIDIQFKGQEPEFNLTGEISRQADLSAVLKMLKLLDINYELQGRTLIISN